MALLEGIGTGLLLSLFIGPSFFYLIKVSLFRGWMAAMQFALGIMLSDVLLILLINLGLGSMLQDVVVQQFFAFLAGTIILVMGIFSVWVPEKKANSANQIDTSSKASYIAKGFSINFFNPFTIGVWVGVLGTVQIGYSSGSNLVYFLVAVVLTILIMDILKAYSANYLSSKINEDILAKVNRWLGVVFILLGLRLYWFLIEGL